MKSQVVNTVRRGMNCCTPLVIATGLVLALTASFTPIADAAEGYDLMRVITSQWVKPSVMIAVDTSKSMKKDFGGNWRDVDWQGGYRTGWWGDDWYLQHWDCECADWETEEECVDWECNEWETQDVCAEWECTEGHWYDACIHWNTDGVCDQWEERWECDNEECAEWETEDVCVDSECIEWETEDVCVEYVSPPNCRYWRARLWVYDSSRMTVVKNVLGDSVDIWTDFQPPDQGSLDGGWDPDDPALRNFWNYSGPRSYGYFVRYDMRYFDYHTDPGLPFPARDGDDNPNLDYWTHQMPLDLVGASADSVYWGLITFGREISGNPVNVRESIDPPNNAAVVASIEDYMRLQDDGGLNVNHQTPTRTAVDLAGTELNTLYEGAADCGQTYGTILITDGQSNIGNTGSPADTEWNSCNADAATTWDDYPPGAANAAWDQFVDFNNVGPRTWVIGVSQDVGACELNWTAFMGRTDASSPLADSGFLIDDDPYLARDAPSNIGVFDDTHGDYAYFSNSASELKSAFDSILAGMGVGDYATSAPAVAGGGSVLGNMALLASTDYPSWQGHLRAFKQVWDPDVSSQIWVEEWDSGEVMADETTPNGGYARKIYSWDSSLNLVEVSTDGTNVSDLDSICGGCGIDNQVVDFIRGNDGAGTARPWQLGALINTTPAVVGPPRRWTKGQIQAHETFEETYSSRHSLIWVGSSDGMVHALDTADGAEVLALIPPDLLDMQVELYEKYLEFPDRSPLGQAQNPADHNYGVANSVRYGDVYDADLSEYRSIIFITEGPGGTGVHAIDVTHPYPGRTIGATDYGADPDYDGSLPIEPLWSRTQDGEAGTTATADLGHTWSVPALAVDDVLGPSIGYSSMILAEGYTENEDNSLSPHVFMIDPTNGDIDETHQVTNVASPLVGNQTFADSTLWQTDSEKFFPDNVADEGVQLDLNGTVWGVTANNWHDMDPIFELGADNPLYYASSVGTSPASAAIYDLFVFSSGSYYEKSSAVTSSSTTFVPKLVLGVREIATENTNTRLINITDLPLPVDQSGTLGDLTQPIAPPILLTPAAGCALPPLALYLVYDPEGSECVGKSYIVRVEFDAADVFSNGQTAGFVAQTYEAGEGAAGGFAIAGDKLIASQSGVGADAEAHLVEVPDLTLPVGNTGADNVQWWIELQ